MDRQRILDWWAGSMAINGNDGTISITFTWPTKRRWSRCSDSAAVFLRRNVARNKRVPAQNSREQIAGVTTLVGLLFGYRKK
jgi:hypothetical protein